jgi:hypothetical protein
MGDGHGVDADFFDAIGGLQLSFEGGGTLVFEDHRLGEQAMTAAVLGGAEFAQGCFRATRFSAVGAGGIATDALRASDQDG